MTKRDPHYAPEPEEHPDRWHRHLPEEGSPQDEHAPQADPYLLAGIGAALTVGFVILLVVIVLYFFRYSTQARQAKMETTLPATESYEYRSLSMERLNQNTYAWADLTVDSPAVQVPIEQAIEKVIARYAQNGGR